MSIPLISSRYIYSIFLLASLWAAYKQIGLGDSLWSWAGKLSRLVSRIADNTAACIPRAQNRAEPPHKRAPRDQDEGNRVVRPRQPTQHGWAPIRERIGESSAQLGPRHAAMPSRSRAGLLHARVGIAEADARACVFLHLYISRSAPVLHRTVAVPQRIWSRACAAAAVQASATSSGNQRAATATCVLG
jgi:hypothetical protein